MHPFDCAQMLSWLNAGGGNGSPSAGTSRPQQYVIKASTPLEDPQRFSEQPGGQSLDPSVTLEELSCAGLDSRAKLLLTFSHG